jgi:hypothetical protein
VALFDPLHPTNTWRLDGGVQFTFPQGITLAGGGCLLVVNFDPDHDPAMLVWFRQRYGVSPATPIFGPFQGDLANSGERVGLYQPDAPEPAASPVAGFVPYVLVEEVHYSNQDPWPIGADGTGNSLQRLASVAFADDPANWQAAAPTPGALNRGAGAVDTDHDGLPDEWELANGLDPRDGTGNSGASGDPDGDGMNNLAEYLAGTSPTDAASSLRLQFQLGATGLDLWFEAASNHSYTVQRSSELVAGAWEKLLEVPPSPTNRLQRFSVTFAGTNYFYRLRTP